LQSSLRKHLISSKDENKGQEKKLETFFCMGGFLL